MPGVVGVNGVSSGVDADAVAIGVGAIGVADTDAEDDEIDTGDEAGNIDNDVDVKGVVSTEGVRSIGSAGNFSKSKSSRLPTLSHA